MQATRSTRVRPSTSITNARRSSAPRSDAGEAQAAVTASVRATARTVTVTVAAKESIAAARAETTVVGSSTSCGRRRGRATRGARVTTTSRGRHHFTAAAKEPRFRRNGTTEPRCLLACGEAAAAGPARPGSYTSEALAEGGQPAPGDVRDAGYTHRRKLGLVHRTAGTGARSMALALALAAARWAEVLNGALARAGGAYNAGYGSRRTAHTHGVPGIRADGAKERPRVLAARFAESPCPRNYPKPELLSCCFGSMRRETAKPPPQ